MNKTFIIMLLCAAMGCAMSSCSEADGISIVPKFGSITAEPATPHPGDSVTFTAHQSVKGKLIYSATYEWAFRYYDDALQRDTTVRRTEEVVYDYIGGTDPQMGLRLPAHTTATRLYVSLNANYGLSGQTEQGQIFGQASANTSVTIQQ